MKARMVYRQELIGEMVEVTASANESNVGLRGKVIDETKSTFKVDAKGNIKTLLKSLITLKILRTGDVVRGKDLLRRPEERIKG